MPGSCIWFGMAHYRTVWSGRSAICNHRWNPAKHRRNIDECIPVRSGDPDETPARTLAGRNWTPTRPAGSGVVRVAQKSVGGQRDIVVAEVEMRGGTRI
jgi:hypothetical protein